MFRSPSFRTIASGEVLLVLVMAREPLSFRCTAHGKPPSQGAEDLRVVDPTQATIEALFRKGSQVDSLTKQE